MERGRKKERHFSRNERRKANNIERNKKEEELMGLGKKRKEMQHRNGGKKKKDEAAMQPRTRSRILTAGWHPIILWQLLLEGPQPGRGLAQLVPFKSCLRLTPLQSTPDGTGTGTGTRPSFSIATRVPFSDPHQVVVVVPTAPLSISLLSPKSQRIKEFGVGEINQSFYSIPRKMI